MADSAREREVVDGLAQLVVQSGEIPFGLKGEGDGEALGVGAFFVRHADVCGEFQLLDVDGVIAHGVSAGESFFNFPPHDRMRAFAPADSASWILPART